MRDLFAIAKFSFISVSVFQAHDVTFFGLLGASPPRSPPGLCSWAPLWDFCPVDSLPVPLPNQNPGSAPGVSHGDLLAGR